LDAKMPLRFAIHKITMNTPEQIQNQPKADFKQTTKPLLNPLAFPRAAFFPQSTNSMNWSYHCRSEDGMTLRDFFAIQFAAQQAENDTRKDEYICQRAYELADRMLEARLK